MKKPNKIYEFKKISFKDKKNLDNNSYISSNIKKDKIIKDLKLKGFNQKQICDIFETFISNTIDKDILNTKKEEENHQSIQVNNFINNNLNNNLIFTINENINNKNKRTKNIHSCSRDHLFKKNSFLLRTENSEIKINKKNLKCNYLKIYINNSQKKQRDNYSKSKEKNIINKINKKISIIPHSAYNTRDNYINIKDNNNSKSKKKITTERNEKIRGYIKKYNSQFVNGITAPLNEKKNERSNKKF